MERYTPKYTDHELSPYTGLTRKSWIDAAKYLMRGIFENIKDMDAPVVVPRVETEVTYPHLKDSPGALEAQKKAEIFEGLTRSFLIASVLIADDPELTIAGIRLKDYYSLHILRSCTEKGHAEYAGSYGEMKELVKDSDPFRPFQQTVETCALVIGLYLCREVLWETYPKEEQDKIASFLLGFAHANTAPQNWRLFNMLDMAFLHMYGYEIDEEIMLDHALSCLNYYVGDGWYRDGHSFDYYSCWAFQFYAPLWCEWYGFKKLPRIAERFAEASAKLMESYPDMFDEDGFTNMWGRSSIYRNAATSAFDGNLFLTQPTVDCGLARRIASGSLLQFMLRDDFLIGGIPSLGFYGQFTPLIQPYSCAESVFWIGKAFLCLHLKEDHPFWSARENNGSWEKLKGDEVKETVLPGPALVFTDHKANGETILRTAKVLKQKGDDHGMQNYSKLCYNTKYPWESSPVPEEEGIDSGLHNATPQGSGLHNTISQGSGLHNVESMQYVLTGLPDRHTEKANVTLFCGSRGGVLYRRQFFDYDPATEAHWLQAADLADFPVSLGILRADRFRICRRPMAITLGSYGFPDNGDTVIEYKEGESIRIACGEERERFSLITPKAVILSGRGHTGCPKRLAFTVYTGFESPEILKSRGTNPDSECSLIPYASGALRKQYGGFENTVFISQTVTRDDETPFREDELFPILEILTENDLICGRNPLLLQTAQQIRIRLKSGAEKVIDYSLAEARLTV